MSNNGNGASAPNNTMQVNPIEAARAGLMFLQRVQFVAAERQAFDAIEAMLNAIAKGEVSLSQQQSFAAALQPDGIERQQRS